MVDSNRMLLLPGYVREYLKRRMAARTSNTDQTASVSTIKGHSPSERWERIAGSTAVLAHIPGDGLKSRFASFHQLSAESFERQTFVH